LFEIFDLRPDATVHPTFLAPLIAHLNATPHPRAAHVVFAKLNTLDDAFIASPGLL